MFTISNVSGQQFPEGKKTLQETTVRGKNTVSKYQDSNGSNKDFKKKWIFGISVRSTCSPLPIINRLSLPRPSSYLLIANAVCKTHFLPHLILYVVKKLVKVLSTQVRRVWIARGEPLEAQTRLAVQLIAKHVSQSIRRLRFGFCVAIRNSRSCSACEPCRHRLT